MRAVALRQAAGIVALGVEFADRVVQEIEFLRRHAPEFGRLNAEPTPVRWAAGDLVVLAPVYAFDFVGVPPLETSSAAASGFPGLARCGTKPETTTVASAENVSLSMPVVISA